jgi:hypothetical protein
MAWWNWLGDLFKGGKEVAEVFTENKENQGKRAHDETMAGLDLDKASLMQFAAEFHDRSNRTWWDSLVDGLNRLPRPLMAIAVLGFFVLAPLDPLYFMQIAKAYEVMPEGYWALLSVVIGFYFGGRMQLKSQDMTVKNNAVQAAKELVKMKQQFREIPTEEESPQAKMFAAAVGSGVKVAENKVVKQWLKNR